jgi:hypothetical protein
MRGDSDWTIESGGDGMKVEGGECAPEPVGSCIRVEGEFCCFDVELSICLS